MKAIFFYFIIVTEIAFAQSNEISINLNVNGVEFIDNKFPGWYFINIESDSNGLIGYNNTMQSIVQFKNQILEMDNLINCLSDSIISFYLIENDYKSNDSLLLKQTIRQLNYNFESLTDIRFHSDNGAVLHIANQWAYLRDLKKIMLICLCGLIE